MSSAPPGRPMPAMCAGWSPPSTAAGSISAVGQAIHLQHLVHEEPDVLVARFDEEDARLSVGRLLGEAEAAAQVDDRHEAPAHAHHADDLARRARHARERRRLQDLRDVGDLHGVRVAREARTRGTRCACPGRPRAATLLARESARRMQPPVAPSDPLGHRSSPRPSSGSAPRCRRAPPRSARRCRGRARRAGRRARSPPRTRAPSSATCRAP